jgi:3-phosphoshikimate 1-carboxyvinyltransferase
LLSKGTTRIKNPLECDDTEATSNSISALGAKVAKTPEEWVVESPGTPSPPFHDINCGESGVTMRFTIPIASLTGSTATLTGKGSLLRRPIEPLTDAMNQLGVRLTTGRGFVKITGGPPEGGTVNIRGDVSSQFISGLLLSAPLMKNGLRLNVTTKLESRSYVSLTIQTMSQHRVTVNADKDMTLLEVTPGQSYLPTLHNVPGDYSSAAFLMAAALVTNSKLLISNLQPDSSEPDSSIVDFLRRMGATPSYQSDGLRIQPGELTGQDFDLTDCPDLGPIMAVLGCYATGKTTIRGAGRLRFKESDRLASISTELNALGADIKETETGLEMTGPSTLRGGTVRSHGDHRIAMALAVAALRADGNVTIQDAECVAKSYPRFFEDFASLGVELIG